MADLNCDKFDHLLLKMLASRLHLAIKMIKSCYSLKKEKCLNIIIWRMSVKLFMKWKIS